MKPYQDTLQGVSRMAKKNTKSNASAKPGRWDGWKPDAKTKKMAQEMYGEQAKKEGVDPIEIFKRRAERHSSY